MNQHVPVSMPYSFQTIEIYRVILHGKITVPNGVGFGESPPPMMTEALAHVEIFVEQTMPDVFFFHLIVIS
jgi:hypothetical protein